MANIDCDNCGKKLIKTVFCCDKCRVYYFRKNHSSIVVTKRNVTEVTDSFKERKPLKACSKHGGSFTCGCS